MATHFGTGGVQVPTGQHRRKEKILVAGAVQKEKKESPILKALGSLSMRERVMIGSLVVVAIAAAVVFLLILPSLDRIKTLEDEIYTLEGQKVQVQQTLDLIPEYKTSAEAAEQDYKNYQHFYYEFMDPETIDKTVTNMLLNNDMHPLRLSMTSIVAEEIPQYVPFTLVPKPVPSPEETTPKTDSSGSSEGGATDNDEGSGAENPGGSNMPTGPQAAEADAAGNTALAAGSAEAGLQEGKLIYCYTVDVEAQGWMSALFCFLADAKGITAMEVVSYSYTEPPPVQQNGTKTGSVKYQEYEGGTIIMKLKLYVFVDGGVTSPAQ